MVILNCLLMALWHSLDLPEIQSVSVRDVRSSA
jgi:hypothetical protein